MPLIGIDEQKLNKARCSGLSSESATAIFFGSEAGRPTSGIRHIDLVREAYCKPCPVRGWCYDRAMDTKSTGIWAGERIYPGTELKTRVEEWELMGKSGEAVLATRAWTKNNKGRSGEMMSAQTILIARVLITGTDHQTITDMVDWMDRPITGKVFNVTQLELYEDDEGRPVGSVTFSFGPSHGIGQWNIRKRFRNAINRFDKNAQHHLAEYERHKVDQEDEETR